MNAAVADVAIHPSLLEWVRECSGASFLCMTPAKAQPYLDLGLLARAGGTLHDTREDADAGRESEDGLFVLTRRALQLAYPDGAIVTKYQCSRCDKVTAGRMARHLDEDGEVFFYPRRHTTTGRRSSPECPGSHQRALYVQRRITF